MEQNGYEMLAARIAEVETMATANILQMNRIETEWREAIDTRVATWDFDTLYDEVKEMRSTLYRLRSLLESAEDGMFDKEQFLGDLRDLLV